MSKRASVIATAGRSGPRDVKEVPFVELHGGRLQGVVSSGSDPQRVYVAFVEGRTGDYYCSTNNNRPCGGLRGATCKHIRQMIDEAIVEFGAEVVANYLGVEGDPDPPEDAHSLLENLRGSQRNESPGMVFSRFLDYLRDVERGARPGTLLEMNWFAS